MNTETSEKLIKYLIKHQHWSPLEMANACLEIETTRDIAHQIVRHRSFSFQEFSQRYADPDSMGDTFTTREARLQDNKNRQNSIELSDESELHYGVKNKEKLLIRLGPIRMGNPTDPKNKLLSFTRKVTPKHDCI